MSRRTSKKGRAAHAALLLSLTKRQAAALMHLVEYTFREEERHFYEEQPEDRAASAEAGVDDFLAKPVRQDELLACLAKWVKPAK